MIHTLSTWYEISELQATVNAYASTPNIDGFIALMQENVMYLRGDTLPAINEFLSNWEMAPGSPELGAQSVEFANKLVENKMNIPTVGASGAVFGVLLAFGMLFPNTLIYLYFAIPIKAKYLVILYGLL